MAAIRGLRHNEAALVVGVPIPVLCLPGLNLHFVYSMKMPLEMRAVHLVHKLLLTRLVSLALYILLVRVNVV